MLFAKYMRGGLCICIKEDALHASTRPYPLDMRGTSIIVHNLSGNEPDRLCLFRERSAILHRSGEILATVISVNDLGPHVEDDKMEVSATIKITNAEPISLN
jgi:hypothetical protein